MIDYLRKISNRLATFTTHKSKILENIRWLFFDKIFQIILGFLIISLLARHLGTEKYGLLSYTLALVGILQPLSTFGLNSIVVRELAQSQTNKNKILGTTFFLNLLGGFLTLFFGLILSNVLHPNDFGILYLVIILSFASVVNSIPSAIDLWFQSQLQSRPIVYANNIGYIIYFIATIVLIYFDITYLIAFALIKLLNSLIRAGSLSLFFLKIDKSMSSWSLDIKLAISLLRESYPLILSAFATTIYLKIDTIMLGQMTNNQEVAIYSVAAQISEIFYFIPVIILNSFSPSIYQSKKRLDEFSYYRKIKVLLCALSITSILLALTVSFLSPNIIILLFGNAYKNSIQILQIHIWASIFVFSGTGASCWFTSERLTHLTFYRTIVGALTNIVLNLYLIPNYSGLGAAIATVISYAIGSLIANFFYPQTKKLFWLQINCLILNFRHQVIEQ